jgi:hypothetical protein
MLRRTALPISLLLGGLLLAVAPSATAEPLFRDASQQRLVAERERVAAATVTLPERSCAGSVAGSRATVLTAAHCISQGATRVDVETRDGEVLSAAVAHLDREGDLALLALDRELPVEPLVLATTLPRRGDRLLFVGRVDRPSRTQVVRVDKLDQCPSLPDVPRALFTSVHARPGDSGAPLVELTDGALRVVAVVHGGSRCHIAAPTAPLASVALPSPPQASTATPPAPRVAPADGKPPARAHATKRLGPFVFERTPDGFRFSFKFDVEWRTSKD